LNPFNRAAKTSIAITIDCQLLSIQLSLYYWKQKGLKLYKLWSNKFCITFCISKCSKYRKIRSKAKSIVKIRIMLSKLSIYHRLFCSSFS